MKRLIWTLLLCLCLSSCERWDLDKQTGGITQGAVLKKESLYNRGHVTYNIYVFDGQESEWLSTDYETYNSVKEGQKLDMLVVRRTYFKEKH